MIFIFDSRLTWSLILSSHCGREQIRRIFLTVVVSHYHVGPSDRILFPSWVCWPVRGIGDENGADWEMIQIKKTPGAPVDTDAFAICQICRAPWREVGMWDSTDGLKGGL